MLTPDGKPIPGLSLKDAPELYGDSVEEQYAWKSAGELGKWAGKPVRLRFHLQDADLYALRFAE